jgi:hypothetical protein
MIYRDVFGKMEFLQKKQVLTAGLWQPAALNR